MEGTAISNLEERLPEGYTSVGTRLDLHHERATPVGAWVRCESELVDVEGRALTFHIEAFDEKGRIGHATHQRFVVHAERFMGRL